MVKILYLILFFSIGLATAGFCFNEAKVSLDSSEIKILEEIETRLSLQIILPDLLNYAYITNPAIKASKQDWKISIENYNLGKSYPDPTLMTTYYPAPIETRLGPQDWNISLSQQIPFPGLLSGRGKVLEAQTRISKLNLDKIVKNTAVSLMTSLHELVYIQKAVQIAESNFNLAKKLLKTSENFYATDKALFYDISKARAQTAQIQYDILLLKELEQAEKAFINSILSRAPGAPLGSAKNLSLRTIAYSVDEIYQSSIDHQEDVLIALETINKSDEQIKLSRLENLPTFKLGLFYASIGDPDVPTPPPDAGDDAVGIQFGFNIPLWYQKNKSRTLKALAVKEKARANKIDITNKTKAMISRLWFKLQNSKRLITLYKDELIPQSLKSVQTAETWFRNGEGSFSDFLEVQATAYNFQLSLARATADYSKTLVKLEQLAGVSLDKKSISPKESKEEVAP